MNLVELYLPPWPWLVTADFGLFKGIWIGLETEYWVHTESEVSFATMSTTSDALLALQQAIKSKSPITFSKNSETTTTLLSATHLNISPGLSFPKATPTRYRKPGASSNDPTLNPQDFYTLDACYLAWLLQEVPGSEYVKQVRENGVTASLVGILDRRPVVEWLEGKRPDDDRIASIVGE